VRRPSYNRRRRHGSQPCYYPNTEGQEQREAGIHESSSIVIVELACEQREQEQKIDLPKRTITSAK